MKTLYLVRHGESEGNAQKVYQTGDSPLSALGMEQAGILKKRFETIRIDALYSSPLRRARETAEVINERLGLPLREEPLATEWRKPSSLRGVADGSPEDREFRDALRAHKDAPYWKWRDEESLGEMRDRIGKFLEKMKEVPEENILVVMHSRALKTALSHVLLGGNGTYDNVPEEDSHVSTSNTGITVLKLPDGKDYWRLLTWNDHAHLGEL